MSTMLLQMAHKKYCLLSILLAPLHSLVTHTQRDVAHVTLRFTQQEFMLHIYLLKVSGFSFLCFKTCDTWVEFKYPMHFISLTAFQFEYCLTLVYPFQSRL